ncbi:MAG: hypothetical protein JWM80_3882 [Cyanobacteria bacterium RYN_339]|nr:hypothetical protein [Cyanobacteria bacterium RYN_339]
MSKSKKKQKARERVREEAPLAPPPEAPDATEEPALALPERKPMPLDQGLYDRVVAAATKAGQLREEGDRLTWVYNGDAVAMKYTEPGEAENEPARVLVAAFRQGVVFQVEGETQLAYQPGAWELELDKLEPAPDDEDDDDVEDDVEDEPDDAT